MGICKLVDVVGDVGTIVQHRMCLIGGCMKTFASLSTYDDRAHSSMHKEALAKLRGSTAIDVPYFDWLTLHWFSTSHYEGENGKESECVDRQSDGGRRLGRRRTD